MDRELVLTVLALALTGMTLRCGALWSSPGVRSVDDATADERARWQHIWLPLAPTATVIAALAGWAMLEPDNAERVPVTLLLLAVPSVFVWTRACWRAAKALRSTDVTTAAAVGLWRPRVVTSATFRERVDADALHAAVAHEAAHARHRDPLRLWIAQFATDLQWPSTRADTRLQHWLYALECARDDEARHAGVHGDDLATAILAAARMNPPAHRIAITGGERQFAYRIQRLMKDVDPTDVIVPHRRLLVVLPILIATVCVGAWCGEWVVRTVFSALP